MPARDSINYGGQAVMEGVMMRGERNWAVCVREPSGNIVIHQEPLDGLVYRSKFFRWPFLRGLVMLWDSLGLGMRALIWSAGVAMGEDDGDEFSGPVAWGTVVVSVALGVGLFILLPAFLIGLLDQHIGSPLWSNLAEGGLRLALFVGYVVAIGQMPDIGRVFAYHGAEHKTINAYERGAALVPESVAGYSRVHTRCGTGFLLVVLVLFVLLATLMGRPPFLQRLLSRIVLLPIVAGISYELLRLSSKYYETSALLRALTAPGLALQRLTTREPDPAMLEVSIAALKAILPPQEDTAPDGGDGTNTDEPALVVSRADLNTGGEIDAFQG